jgi:cytochrome c1
MKRTITSLLSAAAFAALTAGPALAAGEAPHIEKQRWTFSGLRGHFDQGQLQRGYQVYKEVCAGCHSMRLLKFRNLGEPGGPMFSEAAVKALAAETTVPVVSDSGKVVQEPAKPSDALPSPFKNEQEARSANNGAYPPDLSVIAKARSIHSEYAWYQAPLVWLKDILSSYQEGGADYLYAVLTGYGSPPAGMKAADGSPFKLADGMHFNKAFPGYQIAMPQPIADGQVKYTDGSPATIAQYSKDVTAFLMWAAEPHLNTRKAMGLQVLIYLAITAVLLWFAKRRLWARVDH